MAGQNMKKSLTTLAFVTFFATAANAASGDNINRYNVQDMTCNQVHAILDQQGAAILRYPSPQGTGRILYDRYVRDPTVCFAQAGHAIQRTIPVKDTNACPTLSCEPGPPECDEYDFGLFGCYDND